MITRTMPMLMTTNVYMNHHWWKLSITTVWIMLKIAIWHPQVTAKTSYCYSQNKKNKQSLRSVNVSHKLGCCPHFYSVSERIPHDFTKIHVQRKLTVSSACLPKQIYNNVQDITIILLYFCTYYSFKTNHKTCAKIQARFLLMSLTSRYPRSSV